MFPRPDLSLVRKDMRSYRLNVLLTSYLQATDSKYIYLSDIFYLQAKLLMRVPQEQDQLLKSEQPTQRVTKAKNKKWL